MNQTQSKPDTNESGHVEISLKGTPHEVYKLLQGLAGTLPQAPVVMREPEQLYIGRALAAQRSGFTEDHLSGLIRIGKLTNHGTPRRMLFSLAEIRALGPSID